jgi:AmmeMemoRadiSam system protein B
MSRPDLVRRPCVAGQFYPDDPEELLRLISSFKPSSARKQDAIGCLLPHAGYIYSGKVAAQTLAEVNIRDTLILIGPNHSGNGPDFSLMPAGSWQTPFGNVEIDAGLAGLFLARSKYLKADTFAHVDEHSLEVELPILQYFRKRFQDCPDYHQGRYSARA